MLAAVCPCIAFLEVDPEKRKYNALNLVTYYGAQQEILIFLDFKISTDL